MTKEDTLTITLERKVISETREQIQEDIESYLDGFPGFDNLIMGLQEMIIKNFKKLLGEE